MLDDPTISPGGHLPGAQDSGVELRPEVWAFAQAMESRLRANDHRTPKWPACSDQYLTSQLLGALGDFVTALTSGRGIRDRGADIANYVMFLVDNHTRDSAPRP